MTVLDLYVGQIVWFDNKFIKINHIDNNFISVVISYDILDNSIFHDKIGWDFSYFPHNELSSICFE